MSSPREVKLAKGLLRHAREEALHSDSMFPKCVEQSVIVLQLGLV
jgi:hypothetical protein